MEGEGREGNRTNSGGKKKIIQCSVSGNEEPRMIPGFPVRIAGQILEPLSEMGYRRKAKRKPEKSNTLGEQFQETSYLH